MSEFPQVLTALMKLEDITQVELERASGIDRTTISRFLRGERLPDRAQLGQLLVGISGDRARKLELLFAHLRDEAAAAVVAGITPAHYVIKSVDEEAKGLPGTLTADLELIAEECAQHDDIRTIVADLSRMIMRHRAELIDARENVYPFSNDIGASPSASAFDESVQRGLAKSAEPAPSGTPAPTPSKAGKKPRG